MAALFAMAALMAGCASVPTFVQSDGTVDAPVLYARRCAQCHEAFAPSAFSDQEWAGYVRAMAPRAGIRSEWRPALVAWLQRANDGG